MTKKNPCVEQRVLRRQPHETIYYKSSLTNKMIELTNGNRKDT